MNLGHSFSRTLWSEVFQRFFPDSSEGVHEKPTILWEGNKFAFLNTEDQRRPSVSIAGNFGEVLQTKNSLQAKNAHQNQIKCNEGYQIRMLKTSILLTGFLTLPPCLHSTVTEHQCVPGTRLVTFSIYSPMLKSRCFHSVSKGTKHHRMLESEEEKDVQKSLA